MAKRKDIQATSTVAPSTSEANAAQLAPAVETAAADQKIELVKVELPQIDPAKIEIGAMETPKVEALTIEAPKADEIAPAIAATPTPSTETAAAPAKASSAAVSPPGNRFILLAASVALAAAFGAVVGALGSSGLMQPASSATTTTAAEDTAGLRNAIAQMRTELAAVRTSVDTATRTSNGQFGKIAERIDRVERAQAEPSAKLAKAVEGIERLQRRTNLAPDTETTGSIAPPSPAPVASAHSQPAIVQGWVVRGVYRGAAIVHGGRFGTMEVEAGDVLPGLGRVESIKRQNGRWVVVTSKGLITSMR